jgi:hypothetical protein
LQQDQQQRIATQPQGQSVKVTNLNNNATDMFVAFTAVQQIRPGLSVLRLKRKSFN